MDARTLDPLQDLAELAVANERRAVDDHAQLRLLAHLVSQPLLEFGEADGGAVERGPVEVQLDVGSCALEDPAKLCSVARAVKAK